MTSLLKFLILMATSLLIDSVASMSCMCYDESLSPEKWTALYCRNDVECPEGTQLVWDACRCCKETCSKLEGEECGGAFLERGVCSDGLECRVHQPAKEEPLHFPPYFGTCAHPTPDTDSSQTQNSATTVTTTTIEEAIQVDVVVADKIAGRLRRKNRCRKRGGKTLGREAVIECKREMRDEKKKNRKDKKAKKDGITKSSKV